MNIIVNNNEIEAYQGETLLTALKRNGINVPTFCHIEGMDAAGACRICVVELEGRGLVTACSFPVAEGMKIKTQSPKVIEARKTILELLLANHPNDCLYCVRNRDCELRIMAEEYGVREKKYPLKTINKPKDISSLSIVREQNKCILCGKCIRVCDEVQSVSCIDFTKRGSNTFVGCAFEMPLAESSCINCGQCINVCPTGALTENNHINKVMKALNDPDKYVVIQHAPSVSVSLAEGFGIKAGTDVAGMFHAALRQMGFKKVFDTSFSADLTIMEEGSELVHRVKNNGKLPMFTSCSPGWVKFVEEFYPEFIDNLSTAKSPQAMLGAITKTYFAQKEGIDPSKIVSVSVMPCTAKKYEAKRPQLKHGDIQDIDYVLTTREMIDMFKIYGIDLNNIKPEEADLPFGDRSSAGKLFGGSGGVMEAALRTGYYLLTGKDMEELKINAVRGLELHKEAKVKINNMELGVAVVSSLGQARALLEEIKNGRTDLHFIEVMTCPGGCINGGGQPFNHDKEVIKARLQALYNIDKSDKIRTSHSNKSIQQLYKDYLGEPLGEKSHHLLHTHYDQIYPKDL